MIKTSQPKRCQSTLLFNEAIKVIPGGVNSPVRSCRSVHDVPLFFKKAYGSRVIDVDDNEYIDMCQSWGPCILGHTHPQVIEAVEKTMKDGLTFGACHAGEVEIADLILQGVDEFDNVRLMNSGTEAVMTAVRLARGFTGRDMIVKFEGGYHGHSDGMLVKAGSGLAFETCANSKGIPLNIAKTTLVSQFDSEECVDGLFKHFGEQIAAVIIEPLPANNGLMKQRKEFLQFVRSITSKYGALLIFDEVISGFRTHYGGFYRKLKIVPDLITLGKIIGGGMPVGAVAGPSAIMRLLAPEGSVYQAGTLSGNPVSLSAGIATLKILANTNVYTVLENLGSKFAAIIEDDKSVKCKVVREGSIIWLYLSDTEVPRSPSMIAEESDNRYIKIYKRLIQEGFYVPPASREVQFLSAAHTEDEIIRYALTFKKIYGEICNVGTIHE